MENELKITVKFSGAEYVIDDIGVNDNVFSLKEKLSEKTGVRPDRQKLLGLKCKG